MNEKINAYLQQLDKQLVRLDAQEKADILEEVESHIFEALSNGASVDNILNALGSPQELAKAYTQEASLKSSSFNLSNLAQVIRFYFMAGFSGMFIVPFLSVLSIGLYLSAFISIAGGVIKGIGMFLGYSLPIGILNFGFWQAPDFIALPFCFLAAFLFYLAAKKLWSWLKRYLLSVSVAHRKLKKI